MIVGEDGWWGAGTDLGRAGPAESWWGVGGVSWRCGGGHMEGRLALWLPLERAPADRGRLCQEEGREQRERGRRGVFVVCDSEAEFGAAGTGL